MIRTIGGIDEPGLEGSNRARHWCQGIGRSIAKALAREGVMVIGAARRTALIEELSAEAQLAGGMPIRAMHVDMMDPGAVSGLARDALDLAPGRLDILVNAAGASRPMPTDAPAQEWEDAMRLGFLAPRALAHDLLPAMQANNWGRIVNITGTSEPRFLSASTPAKAALHVWSKGPVARDRARRRDDQLHPAGAYPQRTIEAKAAESRSREPLRARHPDGAYRRTRRGSGGRRFSRLRSRIVCDRHRFAGRRELPPIRLLTIVTLACRKR